MRRIVTLVGVALVMAAMMLTVTAPAMAEPRNFCSFAGDPGTREAPNVVIPGSEPRSTVLFDCVPRGERGQPPLVLR